ncbi:MAG: Flagellin A2 [Candidatus Methanogaster sp.]|nr:MAG: Flagellin A2 [ANME-2 cluster archaeon]
MMRDRRAQVGIGTLIIFIAMVLVAAVAAAVLIQTSGVLQQKAQTTGKEATKEVSSNIDIDSIEGWRGGLNSSTSKVDSFSDEIYRLDMRCSLKVGSEPVDLNQVVITITDGTMTNDLRYIEGSLVTAKAETGTGNGTYTSSASGAGLTNTTYRLLVDGSTAADHANGATGHTAAMTIFRNVYPDAHVDTDYNGTGLSATSYTLENSNGTAVIWSEAASSTTGVSGEAIAVDAGVFTNNTTAASGSYGKISSTLQDEYFARADKFYVVEEIRDEDKSYTSDNPVMNTGDLVKMIILTGPKDLVTGEGSDWLQGATTDGSDSKFQYNNPLVGEANLNLDPRSTITISMIPEGGAGTTVDFVTPSSFGTHVSVDVYP